MKRQIIVSCLLLLATAIYAATTSSGESQKWWGYVSDDTEKFGVGVSQADTYHCAIFIPGKHAAAAGKTIKTIRFGLIAPNATNVKVWVSGILPTSIDPAQTSEIVDVPDSKLGKDIEVDLPMPFTVSSTGAYVGYSFTITKAATDDDKFPIIVTGDDTPNALLLRTEKAIPSWGDYYGNGFGGLFLQVLLEGTFADYAVTPDDFGPVYSKVSENVTADITVTNGGNVSLTSIDYTVTTDGVTGAEQHAELSSAAAFGKTGKVSVTIPTASSQSKKESTLTITKVNGQANEAVYKSTTFTLYSISEFIDRNVVVEEFTGTGCGWCPRGLVGMEKLRETFGDRFVGIGLHQYNSSDAMYINPKNYARISFGGAPSCRIDRGEEIDPYYGTENDICDDFRAEMAVPALATIAVSGTLNEDATKVDATATVQALFDESYSLEFVLIGDGLKGTGASWNQANYYAQYSATQLPADLAIFGSGGTYGQSSVKGWVFNDVALASSYANGSNEAGQLTLTAGTPQEAAYTLTLPTSTKLKGAIKTDQLYVAALLVDGNGRIANAAKAKVTNEGGTAVSAIQSADAAVVARYSLDGRQLSAPQKGLNIVKLSDGRTVKVLVK